MNGKTYKTACNKRFTEWNMLQKERSFKNFEFKCEDVTEKRWLEIKYQKSIFAKKQFRKLKVLERKKDCEA